MWSGQDDTVQGLGCPGTCMGADGNLYEWVEGVDGLGNPIGFWKRLRRGIRRIAPLARRFAPLVPGGAAAAALTAAAPYLRRAAATVAPPPAAPAETEPPAQPAAMAGWGLGAEELTQVMGIGYAGEMAEGPDGNLYQWVQGIDGLGNPIGFWKRLKRGVRGLVRRALPIAKQFAPFVPGGAAALTAASPFLRQAGVLGASGIGALYEAPDGSLYQVQGIEADEELQGLDDDELQGLNDDELQGLEDDDELRGPEDDELRGLADDEIQGFADDELQAADGFVREGVSGLDGFIPDAPRETPPFRGQSSAMWAPLW